MNRILAELIYVHGDDAGYEMYWAIQARMKGRAIVEAECIDLLAEYDLPDFYYEDLLMAI